MEGDARQEPDCDRPRYEVGDPTKPEYAAADKNSPGHECEACAKSEIVMASGGGQGGKAAGENRGDGRIGAGHKKMIGSDGRESDQSGGGGKSGKMRRRHLRGKGDGGERQPGHEVRTQVSCRIAGGGSKE